MAAYPHPSFLELELVRTVVQPRLGPNFQVSRHPLHVANTSLCFADLLIPPLQSGGPQLTSAPEISVPGLDFESAVLMRMRQAERERLEREIREEEANEA